MKFRHACPIAVALLTATVNLFGQTAPVWTQVSMPYYFAYGPSPSQTQPPASGPYNFYFTQTMSQGVNDQLGCYWNEFAPDYWFNGGTLLSGPIVRTAPAVGTQFQTGVVFQGQIRGIEFKGSFTSGTYPAATTYGNIGAFYYTGNQCLGGTLEYGFAHDYQGDSTNFYLSNHDNCPAGGSVVCRQTSNPADPTVASCGSGLTLPAAYSSGPPLPALWVRRRRRRRQALAWNSSKLPCTKPSTSSLTSSASSTRSRRTCTILRSQ